MASCAIPIEDLHRVSRFARALEDPPTRSPRILAALGYCYLPKLLHEVTSALSGPITGELSEEEARALYEELVPVYMSLQAAPQRLRRHWPVRILGRRWLRWLEDETEELGDLLDTLAWGFDPDLREFAAKAVREIEERQQSKCRYA